VRGRRRGEERGEEGARERQRVRPGGFIERRDEEECMSLSCGK
jgi:hypothetical protein